MSGRTTEMSDDDGHQHSADQQQRSRRQIAATRCPAGGEQYDRPRKIGAGEGDDRREDPIGARCRGRPNEDEPQEPSRTETGMRSRAVLASPVGPKSATFIPVAWVETLRTRKYASDRNQALPRRRTARSYPRLARRRQSQLAGDRGPATTGSLITEAVSTQSPSSRDEVVVAGGP